MTTPPVPSGLSARAGPVGASRICWLLGLVFGILGTLWIYWSYRNPNHALHYHVPLAVAFGTETAWLAFYARGRERQRDIAILSVAMVAVAVRLTWQWPLSGHGVLGAVLGLLAPWPPLRALAWLILPQAFVTKWVGNDDPMSVIFGAAAGILLTLGIKALTRRSAAFAPGTARLDDARS